MEHKEIQKILEFMIEKDYKYDENQAFIDKLEKDSYTLEDHIRALVYSQLSANRSWGPIEDNQEKINKIFDDFDPECLKKADPDELVDKIKDIKCGNISIRKQMSVLKDNIIMLEKIEKEKGLDKFVNGDVKKVVTELAKGEYKLKQVGIALACQYLKGVGIDCAKPDIHLRRILARLGYSSKDKATELETIDIIQDISMEYPKLSQKEIDTILWQYCAEGGLNICGKEPKCDICKIKCDYSKTIKIEEKVG